MKPTLPLLLIALMPALAQAQVPTADPTATRGATRVAPPPVAPRHKRPGRSRRCCRLRSPRSRSSRPVRPRSRPPRHRSRPTRSMTATAASWGPPAGPNRVFDSRTGRYYDSVPAGDGQQIKR